MSAERQVVTFPTESRALPTPADLDRISKLPLVQMFVVGRSGSGLVHAFLDGHPEVLHVPHTFKFYDFVAANPELLSATPRQMAERFFDSPLVGFLFDSSRSVIIGGRLGPEMATYVSLDRDSFCRAFEAAMSGHPVTWRTVFFAIVLAYGWVIGQDPDRIRIVFHHVHHGDWLWPERLLERSNYHTPLPAPSREVLRADRFIVSLREPRDAWMAYRRFIDGQELADPVRVNAQEQFVRLLLQDWARLAHVRRAGEDAHVVRLEDLRHTAEATMRQCASWLGIDPLEPSLSRLTYYGFEWFGDIYTKPSSTVHAASASTTQPVWQDRWLCDVALAGLGARYGYPRRTAVALKSALLPMTAIWPAAALRDRSIAEPAAQRFDAARRASERMRFMEALQSTLA